MRKKILFIDTNVLIQCRALNELHWNEISNGADILLLIPRAVQKEIDRLKHDGNSRRAKRSRKATTLMREIIESNNDCITIRKEKPCVEISFPQRKETQDDVVDFLDRNKPDDSIIADTLSYAKNNPDDEVALLTHDTNPISTAKECSLQFVIVPDDWLLPIEPDDRDKKINKLKYRVTELQNKLPEINVEMQIGQQKTKNAKNIEIKLYKEFSDKILGSLVRETGEKYPIAVEFGNEKQKSELTDSKLKSLLSIEKREFVPAKPDEIQRYAEIEYPKWLDQVKRFFQKLPEKLFCPYVQVDLILKNKGIVPAESLQIEFVTCGKITFEINDKADVKEMPKLLEPPKPPEGKWVSKNIVYAENIKTIMKHSESLLTKSLISKPRDKNSFYFKSFRNSFLNKHLLECKEFMHKSAPETFLLTIYIPIEDKPEKVVIKGVVWAKNMPEPYTFNFTPEIIYKEVEAIDIAKKIINDALYKKQDR